MDCNKCKPILPLELEPTPSIPKPKPTYPQVCQNIVSEECCDGLRISDMPDVCNIDGEDLVPIVHNGSNVAVSINKLFSNIPELAKYIVDNNSNSKALQYRISILEAQVNNYKAIIDKLVENMPKNTNKG